MGYKFIKLSILSLVFILTGISFGQEKVPSDSATVKELKSIFENLEYNTIAYNDLKVKWIIKDPSFVRDVFGRFVVNNALRLNGKKLSRAELKKRAKAIFEGHVVLDLRKRYYDDEIEFFAFVPEDQLESPHPKYLFDPVLDGFYLREIVGKQLYAELQKRRYYYSDITKREYDVKPGYYFDINIEALNPYLMFWSTTSDYRNKYLASFWGKWGIEEVYYPGWTLPQYFFGAQLTYYKFLPDDPNDYTYKVAIGTSTSSAVAYKSALPDVPFMKSANDINFKINGDLLSYVSSKLKGYYVDLSGSFAYQYYKGKDMELADTTSFYSVRDYFNFSITKRKLFNLYDLGQFLVGGGVSTFSVRHLRYIPGRNELVSLDGLDFFTSFSHFVNFKFGVERYGGLIQHHLIINTGYNVTDGYAVVGVDVKAMLSDTFGFRIVYNTFLNLDEVKIPYRTDSQIIFTPIIRINY
jgi:hypothetical protein